MRALKAVYTSPSSKEQAASWTAKKFWREKRLRLKGMTRLELVNNYTNEKRSGRARGGEKTRKSCKTHQKINPQNGNLTHPKI